MVIFSATEIPPSQQESEPSPPSSPHAWLTLPSRPPSVKFGYPPKPLPETAGRLSTIPLTRGEQLIVTSLPPKSPQQQRRRRPSVKELDAQLSAPSPPRDRSAPRPSALAESPLAEGDIPVESKNTVRLPGDAGYLLHRVVPDDNSCLFSAIGVVFEGGMGKAQELRKGEQKRGGSRGGRELLLICAAQSSPTRSRPTPSRTRM